MKLIKLLYIIDRKALAIWGETVTSDTFFSLKHGPIVSQIYDYISSQADPDDPDYCHDNFQEWKDPGNSRLPIQVEDILKALGKGSDEINTIAIENDFYNKLSVSISLN